MLRTRSAPGERFMTVVAVLDRSVGRPGHALGAGPCLSDEAFAEMVRPYLGDMLAAARKILACEHHARDAVQEALLSLWHEETLPPNPRAWLVRPVTHRS